MFNDRYGLTQAVLEGRKTMTRRIIKGNFADVVYINPLCSFVGTTAEGKNIYLPEPTYDIGEEVAIAQAYQTLGQWPAIPGIDWEAIADIIKYQRGWTNKMFVSPNLMPHRIRITEIKAERLREISNEDALKEGIMAGKDYPALHGFRMPKGSIYAYVTARSAYAALIDRICGKCTWARNPLVYAYTFELIK